MKNNIIFISGLISIVLIISSISMYIEFYNTELLRKFKYNDEVYYLYLDKDYSRNDWYYYEIRSGIMKNYEGYKIISDYEITDVIKSNEPDSIVNYVILNFINERKEKELEKFIPDNIINKMKSEEIKEYK